MGALLALELLGTPLCLWVCAWLAAPRGGPGGAARALGHAWTRVWTRADGRRTFLVLALVLALDIAECVVDPALTRALGYDMTRWIHRLEGELVARLQTALALPLPALQALGFFYLAGYVAALLFPFVACAGDDTRARAGWRAWRATFVTCYLLALPFYVFVPVSEVAWSGLASARPALEAAFPGVTDALRGGSALDNCFPSLHVGCTVAAWSTLRRFASPGAARVGAALAVLTGFAVLALGIHWALDAAAGVVFGLVCARIGARFAARQPASQPAASGA